LVSEIPPREQLFLRKGVPKENMKTIFLAGLVAAGAIFGGGCNHSREAAPLAEQGALDNADHKTVETVEKSNADFPELMNQWTRDGWLVLSTSKRATNADGTMHRTVTLAKRKP
jgi:hypothetical protein